jgi:mRNA-degrading endonuclease RelE of RelBE toxin-antitoxin system
MFKFLAKKAVQAKLKDLPPEQRDLIMTLMEEHPELLKKIQKEIKEKKKAGLDENTASMQVMFKYQGEFQKIMMEKMNRK